MDNKPLEHEALNYIESRVASYGYDYADPNYDRDGGDFLILREMDDTSIKVLRCQSKGRSIWPNNTNVSIPEKYVRANFLVFVYLRPKNPDDVKVYLYTGDDIKLRWKKVKDCYRLDISSDFVNDTENELYQLTNNRSAIIGKMLDGLEDSYDKDYVTAITDSEFYFRMWQKMEGLPPLEYLRFLIDSSELLDLISTDKFILMLCAIVIQNRGYDNSLNVDWAFVSLKYSYYELGKDVEYVKGQKYYSDVETLYRNTWVEEMLNDNKELMGYHLHIGDKEECVEAYVLRDGDFGVHYEWLK